ncbi:hypothetical protein HK105_201160 [Polyrhizophydium stewartii]|uniref:Uncharacterized protein n=1 Tax=Polyrhizophydium stewartii TaxID=2732419 RepID=A0ABR4NJ03_9FUNG
MLSVIRDVWAASARLGKAPARARLARRGAAPALHAGPRIAAAAAAAAAGTPLAASPVHKALLAGRAARSHPPSALEVVSLRRLKREAFRSLNSQLARDQLAFVQRLVHADAVAAPLLPARSPPHPLPCAAAPAAAPAADGDGIDGIDLILDGLRGFSVAADDFSDVLEFERRVFERALRECPAHRDLLSAAPPCVSRSPSSSRAPDPLIPARAPSQVSPAPPATMLDRPPLDDLFSAEASIGDMF